MADKNYSQDNNNIEDGKSFEKSIEELVLKVKPRIKVLWGNRKKFIIFNSIVFIITILYLLFLAKPYYRSTVYILPSSGSKASQLLSRFSGLASLTGMSAGEAFSPDVYKNLISSETILKDVIYTKYNTKEYDYPVNLIQYFEIKPKDSDLPDELQEREKFLFLCKRLSKSISSDVDIKTDILTISAEMPESKLSADVVNNIVEALDNYVKTQRKSFATEQREYLDLRTKEVKDTLAMFEEQLKDFRTRNRVTIQSPELQLKEARLLRNIEIQQTVYSELLTQVELVKLEEIKDTPIVNVQEEAKDPLLKEGPRRMVALILVMFFSVLFSGAYFLSREELYKLKAVLKHS